MARALRYDVFRLDSVTKTPQGGLRIPAALTRAGVFEYKRADGSVSRELRHPDDVFHADALASLDSAPLTIGHVGQVDPNNWGSVAVGHVVGSPKKEGDFLVADAQIMRGDAIRQVEAGDLKELSCGYSVDLDPTPGEWQGQQYDARQTGMHYNHVALLPEGAGRAGPDVKLRMDAKDGIADVAYRDDGSKRPSGVSADEPDVEEEEDAYDPDQERDENGRWSGSGAMSASASAHAKSESARGTKGHAAAAQAHKTAAKGMRTMALRHAELGNTKAAEKYARASKEHSSKAKEHMAKAKKDSLDTYPSNVSNTSSENTTNTDALLGRVDSLTEERNALQARLDAMTALIEAAATARASLLSQVSLHMGKDWKADGKSEAQIVKDALAVLRPEMKLDGKSDDYIRGAFEQAVVIADTSRAHAGAAQAPLHPSFLRGDGTSDMDELEARNLKARKKSADAWKSPAKGAMTRDCFTKK